jgi:hypothetical protein
MLSWIGLQRALVLGQRKPYQFPITFECGQKVTVYRFPFSQCFQEHLLSANFSHIRNLSVDALDPWGAYSSDDDVLEDTHSGRWYDTSYQSFCEQTPNHTDYCFHPLAGYVDETGTIPMVS